MREGIETLRVEDAGYAPCSPESNLEHPSECADGICNVQELEGEVGVKAVASSAIHRPAAIREKANAKGRLPGTCTWGWRIMIGEGKVREGWREEQTQPKL